MKPNIAGDYRSDENTVHIERAGQRNWQTAYASGDDSTWQRLPAFTRDYTLDLPHDCIGTAQFDGKQLVGYFQPRALGRLLNGVVLLDAFANGPLLTGQFTATLREDGNFDVVIEQFDGRSGGSKRKPGKGPNMFEPEMEHIETTWVRQ